MFLANFFVDQITTGKNYKRKKGTVLVFLASVLECHHISYFENENYELFFSASFFVDEIMTGKNYGRKKMYYVNLFDSVGK